MKMNILFLLFLVLVLTSCGTKNKSGYLLAYSDNSTGREYYGYKDKDGNISIKAVFPFVLTEKMKDIAFVIKDDKLVAINRRGEVLLTPFIYDNVPDFSDDGFFRFVENNKIGFADSRGNKVINAQFDFVTSFNEGLAKYTIGDADNKTGKNNTYAKRKSGYEIGFVNKYGERFKDIEEYGGSKRKALTLDGNWVLLGKDGRIIRKIDK